MWGTNVAILGLGTMGFGMATSLLRAGFNVQGYDVSEAAMSQLREAGGKCYSSSAEAGKGVEVVVVTVATSDEVDEALYGAKGVISVISDGTTIITCSTLPPTYLEKLEKRLSDAGILLVDAPVTEGSKVATGKLTVMVAGAEHAMEKARPILSAMSAKMHVLEGGAGSGSKMNLVNSLLTYIHLATAAEAMVLGARAGLNTRTLFGIISSAAGSSWAFVDRVPPMLDADYTSANSLDLLLNHFGIILEEAKGLRFPLPLGSAAHQQFLFGTACGFRKDAEVVKIWEKTMRVGVADPKTDTKISIKNQTQEDIVGKAIKPHRIAFIGLGAMGFGMASWLVHEGFSVCGYDVYEPSMARFVKAGGEHSSSPQEAVQGAQVIVLMVTNQDQAKSVLYGPNGAVPGLARGATVVLCSTVSPDFVRQLEARLAGEGRDLLLVDAPVSGGVAKAANGTLTIMSAGSDAAFHRAGAVLKAMSENLYVMEGGPGAGSEVKMVNQLLAGVHIAAAAEGIAFGARLGLNTRTLYDIVSSSTGSSWMFVNRVPHMLDADYTPHSALDIFVKDLGIVAGEAKRLKLPLPLATSALQQFLSGSAAGFGRQDDASVVKVFEKLTGVTVALPKTPQLASDSPSPTSKGIKLQNLEKDSTLKALPREWPKDPVEEVLKVEREGHAKVLVVLDDDPTGTQTVHGVTVLTEWSINTLTKEFQSSPSCFFILTNSRSLSSEEAITLTKEICKNVDEAATAAQSVGYTVVLRGDSTLRGHFPQEADAAAAIIGETDAWIICPFFLQGGRYTINDVHYVADGNMLIPAGQTEFAEDAVFGYHSSNLREWVEEKTRGRVSAKDVASVSIETLRKGGPSSVCQQLCELPPGCICVVNAASNRDIEVFAAGMIQAEARGKKFLCRTAAAFVSARIGLRPQAPLTPQDLGVDTSPSGHNGGLVVVGSYVPKTTKQVEELRAQCGDFLECITVSVGALATGSAKEREAEIAQAARMADLLLASGKDTLVMTSRQLVTGSCAKENLDIGNKVSSALVEIVTRIKTRPRYLLAKGGITSSDLATKAMRAQRAEVAGQALPGVPLWRLGPGSRHPNIPYIVFPGNVGGPDALAQVVQTWSRLARLSTKEILLAAEKGGYAVGAYNVYNLEGVMAVVAAAEAERSPAILQIHPGALTHGGKLLVAACLAAAKNSMVPISVHLDHGSEEHAILGALELGFDSVMVDGSHLGFDDNVAFTKRIVAVARSKGLAVEAELGRLSGTEDGLTVEEYEARFTNVDQASTFLERTQVDALAVCIGNVHGKYPTSGPKLDLNLLKELHGLATSHDAVLVLHGASGIATDLVKSCIARGVRKFNVNTEVRGAYMKAIATPRKDLVDVMGSTKVAMQEVVAEKMRIFGSSGKA